MASASSWKRFTEDVELRYIAAGALLLAAVFALAQFQGYEGSGKGQVTTFLSVEGQEFSGRKVVVNGTTAFELVNSSYSVEYQESSQGIFITSIADRAMNDTHSWIYLVNSEPPEVGAASYELRDGDNVSFRFMSNEESLELFN